MLQVQPDSDSRCLRFGAPRVAETRLISQVEIAARGLRSAFFP